VPLPVKREGVKLGESTLNRFLLLYMVVGELFVANLKSCRRNTRKIVNHTYLPGLPR
jgi:hypothetical protein